jgi:hypothetical protein
VSINKLSDPSPSTPRKNASTSPRSTKAQRTPKLYTLQVFLIGGPVAKVRRDGLRTVQIRGDQTLDVLHLAIFKAFDREEQHLYEFQLGQAPIDEEEIGD